MLILFYNNSGQMDFFTNIILILLAILLFCKNLTVIYHIYLIGKWDSYVLAINNMHEISPLVPICNIFLFKHNSY